MLNTMRFSKVHIEYRQENPNWKSSLSIHWMRWAVFFFFMASIFGLLLRYFFVAGSGIFEYKHVLHAHSHIAILGWGFLLIGGTIVFSFVENQVRLKTYKKFLFAFVLTTIGMMLSFPVQGYGVFSIAFSAIHVLISYFFAYKLFKDLSHISNGTAKSLIQYALIWMLVSSIGLWAIAPIGTLLGKIHPLYFLSVQWFLHFQMNGWFMYAILGILAYHLESKGWEIPMSHSKLGLLHLSLLFTFAFPTSWSYNFDFLLYLNGVGVILQAIAYAWILMPFIAQAFPRMAMPAGWINKMIYVGIISLILKALIQLALIIPEVASISSTIRMYFIGFIHLLMLGALTFGISALIIKNNGLPKNSFCKWGWTILIIAFLATELLLFGQGTLIWAKLGFLPQYHLILFLASLLFPVALSMVLIGLFQAKKKSEIPMTIIEKNITQISINNQTMKKTMIMSLGAVLILMASCGGSGGSDQGKYTPPSSNTKEKVADPKGIGEIRNVDLGDGIDEAMANNGKAILDMKCTACHQLNDKRVVGPGFQGITNRRRPEWIMNMITNVDVMLDEDPVAQALLEECLTRMPNQNISLDESRDILEFLRKNDLEKTGSKDAAIK
ncbi:c-type cytochrome [Cecembia rubra]|nr:c-type cytochrome [Cecembia rubra]